MRSFHWNGEYWYVNDSSVLHRIAHWFVSPQGWRRTEVAHVDVRFEGITEPVRMRLNKKHWSFTAPFMRSRRFCRRDITPLSLFGHRITFMGWGADVHLRDGSKLVFAKNASDRAWRVYRSWDGTPSTAFVYYHGATRWSMNRVEEHVRELREAEASR